VTQLTAADDHFHPVTHDDDAWTETFWFAAAVPERGLGVWTYPLFRPRLGIMSCGVYAWEPDAEELWQLPYYRTYWHMRFPEGQRLTELSLSNGLSYRCLEPLTRYQIAYEDGDAMTLDLTFAALHPPHAYGVRDGLGHLDQLGRVTGEIVLYGERIPVDCIEMRDRTWGPRRESRQKTIFAYDYGARSATSGFHCSSLLDAERQEYRLMTGFVLREHGLRRLTEAVRQVDRDEFGRPAAVALRGRDEDGAEFEAHGEVMSRFGMPSTPWFNWGSIVRWTLPDRSRGYGEDQESWSPERFRALRRATGSVAT
jgi:hypothetical protein